MKSKLDIELPVMTVYFMCVCVLRMKSKLDIGIASYDCAFLCVCVLASYEEQIGHWNCQL